MNESVEREALVIPINNGRPTASFRDRKSTRLNSSHLVISYAVFCLKKKKIDLTKPFLYQSLIQACISPPTQPPFLDVLHSSEFAYHNIRLSSLEYQQTHRICATHT